MALSQRVERLRKKAPPRKKTIVLQWVNPTTGVPWHELILTPDGKVVERDLPIGGAKDMDDDADDAEER